MWWPWSARRRTGRDSAAVENLQLFRVAVECYGKDADGTAGNRTLRLWARRCLAAMFGRAPTEQEIAKVFEDGIPF